MIFTVDQKAALLSLLGQAPYSGLGTDAILALLNAPGRVDNPTPQPTVPTPFTVTQVFGLLSQASQVKIADVPFLPDVRDKILANDRPGCGLYIGLLEGAGQITVAEAGQMMNLIHASGPDPSWSATVEGPTPFQALFPGVTFQVTATESHSGTCTPAMLSEVLS